jgi:hypothetical protein
VRLDFYNQQYNDEERHPFPSTTFSNGSKSINSKLDDAIAIQDLRMSLRVFAYGMERLNLCPSNHRCHCYTFVLRVSEHNQSFCFMCFCHCGSSGSSGTRLILLIVSQPVSISKRQAMANITTANVLWCENPNDIAMMPDSLAEMKVAQARLSFIVRMIITPTHARKRPAIDLSNGREHQGKIFRDIGELRFPILYFNSVMGALQPNQKSLMLQHPTEVLRV